MYRGHGSLEWVVPITMMKNYIEKLVPTSCTVGVAYGVRMAGVPYIFGVSG